MNENKLAANRQNALRSTGPRTPEGKGRASRNAVKHGLLARDAVLPSEDAEAFDAFRSRFVSTLAPVGDLEALLVDRIVGLAWRLGRVTRIEAGLLTEDRDDPAFSILHGGKVAALRLAVQFRGERDELTTLSHLETVLERGLYKALHELERRQLYRGGGAVPPPLALDLDASVVTVEG